MKINKKVIITIITIIAVLVCVVYGATYFFLKNMSIAGGAEGYPIPKDRVNVLVLGVAKGLSDTIMLTSFDPKTGSVDVFSIPRDTYDAKAGAKITASRKINASYGRGGADNVVKAVHNLTGVDINYFVQVDYEAVKAIVDAIGGIRVEITHNMDYDDPADDLHIHYTKGEFVEKGEDIIKVLRWRKNNHNSGGYNEGDIGRVKMQQEVVKLGMQKVLKGNAVLNFWKLKGPIEKNIKTNMTPKQMMYYMTMAQKIKKDNINMMTLPGEARMLNGLSFYVINYSKMDSVLDKIKN